MRTNRQNIRHLSSAGVSLTVCLLLFVLACGSALAADKGKTIVMQGGSNGATACVACHGTDGAGNAAAGYPRLSNLTAGYMQRQLEAYRSGARSNPIMVPIAKALTETEGKHVTEYYAKQESAAEGTDASAKLLAQGRHLARHGDWDNEMPACVSCHADQGQGADGAYFPALAGQHANYIVAQIQAWQSGKRSDDPVKLMTSVANAMTPQQAKAAAAYFANLPTLDEDAVDAAAEKLAESREQTQSSVAGNGFTPPDEATIPDNEFGAMVRLGKQVFVDTQSHASKFAGNKLNCVNCHLNAGRLADAAPLWAAWGMYPAYRGKNDKVNSMVDRMQGCFMFSMNGTAPPADSKVMIALLSYTYWMAQGAPAGKELPGRGYPDLPDPDKAPSPERGQDVYQANCAVCHGAQGEGKKVAGDYLFPPLWGADSYNWGAGMHRVPTAAKFIHANMPLGRGGKALSVQQAWDVAAFVDKHPRPQDPRDQGDMQQTDEQYHDHACYYDDFADSIAGS